MTKPLPSTPRAGVCVESLESRELFSLAFQFDYRYDTTGFFASQARKDVLNAAAKSVSSRLSDYFTAVKPSGNNTWAINLTAPASGSKATISNASLAANTILVFVGARDLAGSTLGQGGPTGWSASGTTDWLATVRGRGQSGATATPRTDYAPKAGAIAFDSLTNWFFGTSVAGIGGTQSDFYSVAAHELGHVLGIGTGSDTWPALVKNGAFTGPKSEALYGGPVPVVGDGGHFADGTKINGQEVAMDPTLKQGTRKPYTELDFAALDDIGYTVTAAPAPTATPGKITGTFFNDADSDGVQDTGEGVLAGWRVFLDTNKNGVWDGTGETSTVTDSAGKYTLTAAAGTYRVGAVLQTGFRRTLPSSGYYDTSVTTGGTATKNFGFTQKVLLSGSVFNDANGNGVRDTGEAGLAGWKIFLDKDKDGVWDSTESYVTTDGNGFWQFKAQAAGTFTVRAVQQTGYTLKSPTTKYYGVSLSSGQTKSALNFAQKKA